MVFTIHLQEYLHTLAQPFSRQNRQKHVVRGGFEPVISEYEPGTIATKPLTAFFFEKLYHIMLPQQKR